MGKSVVASATRTTPVGRGWPLIETGTDFYRLASIQGPGVEEPARHDLR